MAGSPSPTWARAKPCLPVGSLNTAPASTLVLVRVLIITAMLGTLFFGSCFKAACTRRPSSHRCPRGQPHRATGHLLGPLPTLMPGPGNSSKGQGESREAKSPGLEPSPGAPPHLPQHHDHAVGPEEAAGVPLIQPQLRLHGKPGAFPKIVFRGRRGAGQSLESQDNQSQHPGAEPVCHPAQQGGSPRDPIPFQHRPLKATASGTARSSAAGIHIQLCTGAGGYLHPWLRHSPVSRSLGSRNEDLLQELPSVLTGERNVTGHPGGAPRLPRGFASLHQLLPSPAPTCWGRIPAGPGNRRVFPCGGRRGAAPGALLAAVTSCTRWLVTTGVCRLPGAGLSGCLGGGSTQVIKAGGLAGGSRGGG